MRLPGTRNRRGGIADGMSPFPINLVRLETRLVDSLLTLIAK